jgi:hypothetical protein
VSLATSSTAGMAAAPSVLITPIRPTESQVSKAIYLVGPETAICCGPRVPSRGPGRTSAG